MKVRRRTAWVAGGVLGLAMLAGWGMGARMAEPTRVAIVDLERLFADLEEMQSKQGEFRLQLETWQTEINDLKKQIEDLEGNLTSGSFSDQERRALQVQIYELKSLAEAKFQARGQLAEALIGDILRETHDRAIKSVEQIARELGYDLVVLDDRAEVIPAGAPADDARRIIRDRTVLFATESIDITAQVATRMNNEFAAGR